MTKPLQVLRRIITLAFLLVLTHGSFAFSQDFDFITGKIVAISGSIITIETDAHKTVLLDTSAAKRQSIQSTQLLKLPADPAATGKWPREYPTSSVGDAVMAGGVFDRKEGNVFHTSSLNLLVPPSARTQTAEITKRDSLPAKQPIQGSTIAAQAPLGPLPLAPAKAPAVRQSTSGPNGTMKAGVSQLELNAAVLDLNILRARPDYLSDKRVMQYFIALNNCQDLSIVKRLNNELDYPDLVDFYRPQIDKILADSPNIVTQVLYTEGAFDLATVDVLSLGEYSRASGAFPLIFSPGIESQQIKRTDPGDLRPGPRHEAYFFDYRGGLRASEFSSEEPSSETVSGALDHMMSQVLSGHHVVPGPSACPAAHEILESNRIANPFSDKRELGGLPDFYSLNVENYNVRLSSLSMNIEQARSYIAKHPAAERRVYLAVYFELGKVVVDPYHPVEGSSRSFFGRVVKVAVVDYSTDKILGFVFDDGSSPPQK